MCFVDGFFFSIYIFLITNLSRLYYTPCDVLREYTVFDRQSVNPLNCFYYKGNSLRFLHGISRSFVRNKDTLCRCVYYQKITVPFILQQLQQFWTRTSCHLLSVVMNSSLAVLLNRCTEFKTLYGIWKLCTVCIYVHVTWIFQIH